MEVLKVEGRRGGDPDKVGKFQRGSPSQVFHCQDWANFHLQRCLWCKCTTWYLSVISCLVCVVMDWGRFDAWCLFGSYFTLSWFTKATRVLDLSQKFIELAFKLGVNCIRKLISTNSSLHWWPYYVTKSHDGVEMRSGLGLVFTFNVTDLIWWIFRLWHVTACSL